MRPKFLSIKGRRVGYFDEGKGEPLLVIQGWVVCKEGYQPLINNLIPKLRVVIPDLPGHGDSAELPVRHDLKNYLAFIEEFLDKVGLREFHLTGSSLGGSLAILYALKNKNRVKKLILNAPVVSLKQFDKKLAFPLTKPLLNFLLGQRFFQEAYYYHFRKYAYEKRLPRVLRHVDKESIKECREAAMSVMKAYDKKLSKRAMAEFALCGLETELLDDLKMIKNKTLLIWGENDTTLDRKWGPIIKDLIPDCTYLEIKNASHDLVVEKPRQLAEGLVNFVEKNSL